MAPAHVQTLDPDRSPGAGLPESCGVAFKEWAGVCDALAEGRQSLILRKGGIAEGPRGFIPEHATFWLYPTRVHEAEQGLRHEAATPASRPPGPPGTVPIRALALVDSIAFVDREETMAALRDLHAWTEESVARRFHYRRPGLWVLGVRVFCRPEARHVAMTPEHAGCKTWVLLDPPLPTAGCVPVLDEPEFARRRDRLAAALA